MSYTEEKELYSVANVIITENVAFLIINSSTAERGFLSRTAGNIKTHQKGPGLKENGDKNLL